MMRKLIFLFVAAILATSCGSTLYYWGGSFTSNESNYEHYFYNNYKNQTPESICDLIVVYEDMIQNPGGTRQVPPPGICAEYAFLLMQNDVITTFIDHAKPKHLAAFKGVSDFHAYFSTKINELLEMELALYPESAIFIKPLYERINNR